MRTLITLMAFLIGTITFAQEAKVDYKKIDNDLVKATYYFSDNNQVIEKIGHFNAKGKLHGTWVIYDIDGNKKVEANYTDGKKDGVWIYYKDSGNLNVVTYKENKLISQEIRSLAVN